MEVPMKVMCPQCKAVYQIDDSRIPSKGIHGRCPKCKERFFIRKEDGFQETSSNTEKKNQETKMVETPKTLYEKYIAKVNSDHIKAFIERHPSCILHPEIVKLVKIVETNPNMRSIDKASLGERLDIIAKMPEEYFHDMGNVHAGRLWSLAGLQMMRKSGITTYMVIAHKWDHETCDICKILDCKIFEVKQAYNKIMICVKNSRGSVTKMADMFASAFPIVRFEDVDNKSPKK